MGNNWKIRKEAFGGRTIDTSDMFFVEINNKYLVKLQAGSCAEAEHNALALFGVQMANAIPADAKSCLVSAMYWLEPMSIAELEAKSNKAMSEADYRLSLAMEAENAFLKLYDAAQDCANTYGGINTSLMESAKKAWEEACKDTARIEHENACFEI